MAQGKDQSLASRLFHICRKSSQEHKGQESEVPHISEFTIMWDKLSKCSATFPRKIRPLTSVALVFGKID